MLLHACPASSLIHTLIEHKHTTYPYLSEGVTNSTRESSLRQTANLLMPPKVTFHVLYTDSLLPTTFYWPTKPK